MTTNSPSPVDGDVLNELRNRYAEPKIPSCSICGGELSVQRSGGGSPTIWACSGRIDERTWIYTEGRSFADEHYERSRWTDYRRGGDSDVIDLVDDYQALLDDRIDAAPPAQLLRPVELPTAYEMVERGPAYHTFRDLELDEDGAWLRKDEVIQALRQQGYEVKND